MKPSEEIKETPVQQVPWSLHLYPVIWGIDASHSSSWCWTLI